MLAPELGGRMARAVAYYDNIYLVGTNEEKTGSYRVTERDGKGRPGEITFSGNFPMPGNNDTAYGTLVLNEEMWGQWFSGRTMLEHMRTAEIAAEYLVSHTTNIYYGCPLCSFLSKDSAAARQHVSEHINKFISQFRVEIEEDE